MTDKDHMTAPSIRLPSGSNADARTPARAAGKAARKFRPAMPSFFGRTGVYRAGTIKFGRPKIWCAGFTGYGAVATALTMLS